MKEISKSQIFGVIDRVLNRLKLREKIVGLFIFCVILPLITVDGVIINRILESERQDSIREAENTAETILNYFTDNLQTCHNIATSVNQNYKVGEILGKNYASVFDYYENYHKMSENYFFQTLVRFNNMKVKLYTSNESVVSGGYVGKIGDIKDTDWYKAYINSENGYYFACDYDDSFGYSESRRRIFYVGKLKYLNNPYENFIRIDMDYSTVSRELKRLGKMDPVFICSGEFVLFSAEGNNLNSKYPQIDLNQESLYISPVPNWGNIDKIVIKDDGATTLKYLYDNKVLLVILLFISIILPAFVLYEINYRRVKVL